MASLNFMSKAKIPVPLLDLKPQYQALKAELDEAVRGVVRVAVLHTRPGGGLLRARARRLLRGRARGRRLLRNGRARRRHDGARHRRGRRSPHEPLHLFSARWAPSSVSARGRSSSISIPPVSTSDASRLEAAVTERTRVIAPVHLFGQMADIARTVNAVAREHELIVIEDAAQAIGARQNGLPACSFGPPRLPLLFPDQELGRLRRRRRGRDQGRGLRPPRPAVAQSRDGAEVTTIRGSAGNFRLDALQAAVLNVKLRHLDGWHERRRANAAPLSEAFSGSRPDPPVTALETGLDAESSCRRRPPATATSTTSS